MARTQGSRSDVTGPRLKLAALRLFARHGYAAVSMRQIAAEVGVQAGALYLYTADKQSLLFDLMREHLDSLLNELVASPSPASDPRARLEHFIRFHMRFHAARADAVFIAYMELRNLTPDNFAVIEGLRRRYEAALEQILRDGVAEGVFEVPDPRLAAMALIALVNGVTGWFREGGRLSRAQVEDLHVAMACKAVNALPSSG